MKIIKDFIDEVGLLGITFYSIIILSFLAAGIMTFKSIASDGKIQYCYIEYYSPSGIQPVYKLHGFVPWRNDRDLGAYESLNQAKDAAEKIQCPTK